MTPEEKIKEATNWQIFECIAGCKKFMEIAINELKRREIQESSDV